MDAPVTPDEKLRDALASLGVGLEKVVDMLEILLCELIAAGATFHPHPEDEGPIRPDHSIT
jgi:hypothetical protein